MADNNGQSTTSTTKEDIEKNKTMAIIAWFIFFIPLLTDAKNSKFAKFHANQSLLVTLTSLVGYILNATIVGAIIGVPVSIAAFVFWIMGLISAVNGEMKRVPVIGNVEIIK